MIQTVIFDLGGVYFTDGTKKFIPQISKQYGIPLDQVNAVLHGTLGQEYRKGNMISGDFWDKALRIWQIHETAAKLAQLWNECYTPIPGVKAIIERLNSRGYDVLYLSGNLKERITYLEHEYEFLHLFKDGVFSFDAHLVKPDTAFYQQVMGKIKSDPNTCVFIDNEAANVTPAIKLGMHGIVFKNAKQLEDELIGLSLIF